jgi:hypothetical protein
MANIYKNAKVDLTTTDVTTLYSCPSNSRAIIKSILVCNDSADVSTITVTITDSTTAVFVLFNTNSISPGITSELLNNPLVIQESEILKVTAGNSNRLHVTTSILEINRTDQNG